MKYNIAKPMKKTGSLYLSVVLILMFQFAVYGQSSDYVEQFYDHLPYNHAIDLANTSSKVYVATPYSVFVYHKNDNSLSRLTRVEGLNDIDITSIGYNNYTEALLIAYSNANIDVVKGDRIINIADIERSQILGNKTIYDIYMKDQYAYLSCGFGIVVVDLEREEIYDTYKIGPDGSFINVYDFVYRETTNQFFAATEAGVFVADAEAPNLANFIYWHQDTLLPSPEASYTAIGTFGDKVVVNRYIDTFNRDTVFYTQNNGWEPLNSSDHTHVRSFRTAEERLLISYQGAVFAFGQNMNYLEKIYVYTDDIRAITFDCFQEDDTYYIADGERGLVKTSGNFAGEFIYPDGPYGESAFDMATFEQQVWVASGGYQSDWSNTYLKKGIYGYDGGHWTSFNKNNTPAFDSIPDIATIAVHPMTGQIFAGSWSRGLLEFMPSGLQKIWDQDNSSLQGNVAALKKVQISGLDTDSDGNLWVVNTGAEKVLSVKTMDDQWQSFSLGSQSSGAYLREVLVDDFNQKWIVMRDHRILVFNDNNTLNNTSDDMYRILTSAPGNGNLPGQYDVYTIEKDLDGNIWIGTDEGVGVIYNPEDVFTGNSFDADWPKVEVDGFVQYLLNSEAVTAIAVDGAGNLWFGTSRAGVFQMTPDGIEQERHFTTENSPLFSNTINSIAINDEGLVFIGTSKGIISYKGTATPGRKSNEAIFIYPNPVHQGYTGPISISNLVTEANVKITDIQGNLVFEAFAEGGQVLWRGTDFSGKKVKTGYYLVYVTNDDGSETIVSKILIVR